jgi:hypothetical protein
VGQPPEGRDGKTNTGNGGYELPSCFERRDRLGLPPGVRPAKDRLSDNPKLSVLAPDEAVQSLKILNDWLREPDIKVQNEAFVQAVVWLQAWRDRLQDYAILVDKLEETICWGTSIDRERLRSAMDFAEDYDTVYGSLCHEAPPTHWGNESVYRTGGWIDAYLRWASHNESPLAYHFWAAVALLGSAAKRKFFVPRGRATSYPNHYVVLVGHSAIQKSGCFDPAVLLMRQANRMVEDDVPVDRRMVILPEVISAAQMAINLSQVRVRDDSAEKGKGREYIVKPRAETPAIWFCSEFASGLAKDTAQANEKTRMVNELFGRPNFDASSIASGLKEIRNCSLSIVGASTLHWLKTDMDPKVITGGFASRIHWIYREDSHNRPYLDPDPWDPVLGLQLCDLLADLLRTDTPTAIVPTREAKHELKEWYDGKHYPRKRSNDDPDLHGVLGRKDDYIYKLALVIALSRSSPVITLDIMHKAMEIIEYEQTFMLSCFEALYDTEESINQDKLVAKLRSYGGWVTKNDLRHAIGRKLVKAQDWDRVWTYLKTAGRVVEEEAIAGNNKWTTFVRAGGKWEEDPEERNVREHMGVIPTRGSRRKKDSTGGNSGSSR